MFPRRRKSYQSVPKDRFQRFCRNVNPPVSTLISILFVEMVGDKKRKKSCHEIDNCLSFQESWRKVKNVIVDQKQFVRSKRVATRAEGCTRVENLDLAAKKVERPLPLGLPTP